MEDRSRELGTETFGFENWYLRKCQEFVNSKKRKGRQVDSSVAVVAFNMLDDDEFDLESEPKTVYAL